MRLLGIAQFDVSDSYCALEDTLDAARNLDNNPVEGCHYEYVHEEPSSLGFNYAFPSPVDYSHISPMCSQPSISLEYSLDASIDNPKICDCKVDLGHVGKYAW